MANKKQKIKELNQIENVPKFAKLPRKAEPMNKRSSSSSSPASSSSPGSLQECFYDRDEASSATLINFDDKKDGHGRKKVHDSVYYSKSCDKNRESVLNFYEFPEVEAEPVALDKVSDPCSGRVVQKLVEQKSDAKKFQVRGSNGVCITPGNAVWAKTACQVWWPAEIIDIRPILADSRFQQTEENVLVKFYGEQKSVWVNSARDLSMLEDCFEERSCNSVENFQDALKQAIVQRKEHIKSCRQFPGSPYSFSQSDRQDQKSAGKGASSISSKTCSNVVKVKQVGNKKEGKSTIRLDGTRHALKSGDGARRLKIMRHLGLTAPVGSPF
ncbi:hypothetical protein HRI_001666600 [Hibiscus trionum]|uniref:PWWP domain-containing protein n=1 Tax=Hibiscus trionum TaxID=183268 RepID=A0A9W7HQ69_HIBTR|nr:hypothetical protein HRI_001666600 [Hibiscus trionum]